MIFRPSSKGLDHLSLTWKMASEPDIFVHWDIIEKDKPNDNRFAVGRTLEIVGCNEKWEDLDEIYARFKDRMNELALEMREHSKFRFGKEEDVKDMLIEESQNNPDLVPYALR